MRVLFTSSPAYGHLHPMVPLARAFLDAGHELAFATAADFCPYVERCGFVAHPVGLAQPARGEALRRALEETMRLPPAERPRVAFPRIFAATYAPATLPDLRALVERLRPAALVHETGELAGPIAATAAGIPYIEHSFGHLLPADVAERAGVEVAPLWRGVGPPPRWGGLRRHLYLDICPPSLQLPEIAEITTRRALRPVPFDDPEPGTLPGWARTRAALPTVYVTLGTVFNEAGPLFRLILEALRDEPIEIIVTVGPAGDPAALGPFGPRVHVERYLPQTAVFQRCDAVVSHGGSGTLLSALGAGLPLLMIPQGADQFRNAARARAAGVALALWPEEISIEAIRDGVRAVLRDGSYRAAAARVRREIDAMPSPAALVPEIEALASLRLTARLEEH